MNIIKIFPPKDPDEVLDYQFDWAALTNDTGLTDWLEEGETIVSHTVTASTGITIVSSEIINNGTTVRVWVSGGTSQNDYLITCEIATETRTGIRSATLPVRPR
jgi:hypothetical protein